MNPIPQPKGPFIWHRQQMVLLKKWAEIASSYRWMHNQAYMIYRKTNLYYMIPIIVMSTLTGTANFAQSSFPDVIRANVPQIIGAVNLICAIMTTIYQFLKISEYMESHRISSINYGKLARNITTELNIPVKDRDSSGADCVKLTRSEIDRLIEQSPSIPKKVLGMYGTLFKDAGIEEPEIVVIKQVDIYDDPENKVANTVADAGLRFKNLAKKPLFRLPQKEQINSEIKGLSDSKIVTNPPSPLKKLLQSFRPGSSGSNSSKKNLILQQNPFEAVLKEQFAEVTDVIIETSVQEPYIQEPAQEPDVQESIQDSIQEPVQEPSQELVQDPAQEPEVSGSTIQDDLEALRTSKIVSSFSK